MDSEEKRTPETLIEAARQALFQLHFRESIRIARDLLARNVINGEQRDKLYEIYTDALIGDGQLDEAERAAQNWIKASITSLNCANAYVKYANIQHRKGQPFDALKTLDRAQEYAQQSGDRSAAAKVLRLRADIFWAQGSIERALLLLQQALAIQEVLGNKDQQLGIHVSISIVYDLLARPWDATQSSLRAAQLCEAQGDTFSLMIIHNNTAEQYLHLFALDQALDHIRQARALLGTGINGDLERNEGQALIMLGQREEGLALLRRGVEFGNISDHDELLQAMYSLAEGLLTLGHVGEASATADQLLREARRLAATRHIARGLLLVGQIAGRRGDYVTAENVFQEAFVNGQRSGDKWLIWQVHAAMASIFFEAQQPLAEFHRSIVTEMLTGIANAIPDIKLRQTFRNAAPVARWLQDTSLSL